MNLDDRIINAYLDAKINLAYDDNFLLFLFKLKIWLEEKHKIHIETRYGRASAPDENSFGHYAYILILSNTGEIKESLYPVGLTYLCSSYLEILKKGVLYALTELL